MNAPEQHSPFALFKVNDPAAVGLPESFAGAVAVTVESPRILDGERATILTDLGTARLIESAVFELGMGDVPLNTTAILGIARGWPTEWRVGEVEWLDWRAEEVHRG